MHTLPQCRSRVAWFAGSTPDRGTGFAEDTVANVPNRTGEAGASLLRLT